MQSATQIPTPHNLIVDWAAFDPWRIQAVEHRLMGNHLLQPDQLVELGRRLDKQGLVRTHSDKATAGTNFNEAPSMHPNRKSAEDTLRQIRDAGAWMSLLNVQTDSVYRKLVDEVIDELRPNIEKKDPGVCYRGGWIFVTSPKAVTPFHMDKEHNFILQVRGTKTLYVWDHRDNEVISEHARDRFHFNHSRELIKWRDEFKARARIFKLQPGMGAYMPSTSPHMVENDDNPSITVSFTYYTDATRRDSRLHAMHERMRLAGMSPAPVGSSKLADSVLNMGAQIRDFFSRMSSEAPRPDNVPYAHAQVG
jgi:hypothetical protein